MSFIYKADGEVAVGRIVTACILSLVGLIAFWTIVGPIYQVWASGKAGQAELAQAEANRQIKVIEAEAANIAATSNAEASIKIATAAATAEVERAKGVAKANAIIGDSLKGNEDYLRYLYINGLTEHAGQIIYIPTEAGLPILEANRVK